MAAAVKPRKSPGRPLRSLTLMANSSVASPRSVKRTIHLTDSHGYDIHKRTGFPESMTIPGRDAASQVVDDFLELDRFFDLVQALARISYRGIAGRSYRITGLTELIREVESHGYRFDRSSLTFYEDTSVQKTKHFRLSLHVGNTTYREGSDRETLVSDLVNYLFHLGTKFTHPGEFVFTADIGHCCPHGLRSCFEYQGSYRSHEIWRMKKLLTPREASAVVVP